eukprot:scaffold7052_cov254-Pinguiococcus_pyrenoidosus.AAC.72
MAIVDNRNFKIPQSTVSSHIDAVHERAGEKQAAEQQQPGSHVTSHDSYVSKVSASLLRCKSKI